MPDIRVHLFTYRRPRLLARALRSLLAQTHRDWVCELHNDDPADDEPRRVLAEVAGPDPRITYRRHERNLGAVACFNLAFAPGPEPFAAILEDDNWWEPGLLAALRADLEAEPTAVAAWANMHVHEEQADGSWRDTGRTIWPVGPGRRVFAWPEPRQLLDALHSQGAMLFRAGNRPPPPVPPGTPLAQIEPVRERALAGPLVLHESPLGHFALTRTSARPADRRLWLQGQMLIAGSFLRHVTLSPAAWAELWQSARAARPPQTNLLLLLALAGIAGGEIRAQAGAADWFRLAASAVRRPGVHAAALRFRRDHADLWAWLDQAAAARTAEAGRRGFRALAAIGPLAKHPPSAT